MVASLEGRMYPVEVAYLREPTPDYVRTAAEVVGNIHTHVGSSIIIVLVYCVYICGYRTVRVIFWFFLQVARK
jgi:hypothetical protein